MSQKQTTLTEPVDKQQSKPSHITLQKSDGSEHSFELVQREQIENTPFTIVTLNDGENEMSFVSIRDKRISEMQSYGDCLNQILERNYDLLIALMLTIVELDKNT